MGAFAKRAADVLEDWQTRLEDQKQRLHEQIPTSEESAQAKAQAILDSLKSKAMMYGYRLRREKAMPGNLVPGAGVPGREVVISLPAVKQGWYEPRLRSKTAALHDGVWDGGEGDEVDYAEWLMAEANKNVTGRLTNHVFNPKLKGMLDTEMERLRKRYPFKRKPMPVPLSAKPRWSGAGTQKLAEDLIPGGKADGRPVSDFNAKQIEEGMQIEKEHTDSKAKAKEIATDHLTEIPDYYTRLKEMEDEAKSDEQAKDKVTPSDREALLRRLRSGSVDDEQMHEFYKQRNLSPDDAETAIYKETKKLLDKQALLGAVTAPLREAAEDVQAEIANALEAKKERMTRVTSSPYTLPWFLPAASMTVPKAFYRGYQKADEDIEQLQDVQLKERLEKARAEFEDALAQEYAGRKTASMGGVIDGLADMHIKSAEGELNAVLGAYLALASLAASGAHSTAKAWVEKRDPRYQEMRAMREALQQRGISHMPYVFVDPTSLAAGNTDLTEGSTDLSV